MASTSMGALLFLMHRMPGIATAIERCSEIIRWQLLCSRWKEMRGARNETGTSVRARPLS
jgi:hypothetical protein